MTTFPAPIDQRAFADADWAEACGECALAWCLQARGFGTTPSAVIAAIRARGGEKSVATGTDPVELAAAAMVLSAGGARLTWRGGAGALTPFQPLDRLLLVLGHDDRNADPAAAGALEHWWACYAVANGTALVMNPWGGAFRAYPLQQLVPATVGTLEFPAAVFTEESALFRPAAQMDADERRVSARLLRWWIHGTAPATEAALDADIARATSAGWDALASDLQITRGGPAEGHQGA